jgi:hypothetical protein
VADDQTEVGQGLDVLDQGRAAVDPPLERPRAKRGLGLAARQSVGQRRFVAGDESVVNAEQLKVWVPGQARVGPFVGRGHQPFGQRIVALAEGQDHRLGADRAGGDRRAVEDQVRGFVEQRAILGAGRLALGAVGHHRAWTAAAGHRPHLAGNREGGAAPTTQPRAVHLVNQALGRPATQVGQRSEQVEVGAQVVTVSVDGLQQAWQPAHGPPPGDALTAPVAVPGPGEICNRASRLSLDPPPETPAAMSEPCRPVTRPLYWSGLETGPRVTRLLVISTPPPAIGRPRIRIRRWESGWPRRPSEMSTSIRPSGS